MVINEVFRISFWLLLWIFLDFGLKFFLDDYHFSKHNLINDHKEYEPDAFNYDKNCNELIQEKNDSKERENNKEKENELDQKPKSPNSESIIIEL